jgi:hypothetical protein
MTVGVKNYGLLVFFKQNWPIFDKVLLTKKKKSFFIYATFVLKNLKKFEKIKFLISRI